MTIELRRIDENSSKNWDRILMQFSDWSVYQTEAWLDFLEKTQGVKILKLGIFANNQLCGLWPAAEFHKGPFRLLGSPMKGWTTPQMGPASKELNAVDLLKAWYRFLQGSGYHHAQVSHPKFTADIAEQTGFDVAMGGSFVCLIPATEEEILGQFQKSCRKAIRRAFKSGVEVENTDDTSFVNHFYYQLEDVFGKQGLNPTFPKSRIEALWRIMKPTGRLLTIWAKYQGKVIGSGFYLLGNKTLHSYASASLRSSHEYSPNEPIRFLAMKIASENGCSMYDMTGRGDYKAKFGAHLEPRCDVIFNQNILTKLARYSYAALMRLRQRRRGVGQPMSPRLPLNINHHFDS